MSSRLYQEIGIKIKKMLTSGAYPIGSRLPPEREIAELFNVSRTVIREALIMLELENLVDVKKGSGVYVIATTSHQETNDDVGPFELLQARQLLESNVAAFAATQVTKSEIAEMHQVLNQERILLEKGDVDYECDEKFHMLIAHATQNSVLEDMVQNLWDRRAESQMWQRLHTHILNQDYRTKWLEDHQQVLQALQLRNASKARLAMWQHIENVKQTLLQLSNLDDPEFDGYLFGTNPLLIDGVL